MFVQKGPPSFCCIVAVACSYQAALVDSCSLPDCTTVMKIRAQCTVYSMHDAPAHLRAVSQSQLWCLDWCKRIVLYAVAHCIVCCSLPIVYQCCVWIRVSAVGFVLGCCWLTPCWARCCVLFWTLRCYHCNDIGLDLCIQMRSACCAR
jgi:hypothetical protein